MMKRSIYETLRTTVALKDFQTACKCNDTISSLLNDEQRKKLCDFLPKVFQVLETLAKLKNKNGVIPAQLCDGAELKELNLRLKTIEIGDEEDLFMMV